MNHLPESSENSIENHVTELINELVDQGYNFVYIREETGRFGAEKLLTAFPFGYRSDCYCLDNTDDWLKTRQDLERTMARCLKNGIELVDVKKK